MQRLLKAQTGNRHTRQLLHTIMQTSIAESTVSRRATAAHEEARRRLQHSSTPGPPRDSLCQRNHRSNQSRCSVLGSSQSRTRRRYHPNPDGASQQHRPWQLLCREKHSHLKYVGITDDGHLERVITKMQLENDGAKLVTVSHASNVTGNINPVREMIRDAHKHDSRVLVDAAQSVPHMPVDVQDLDCDFLAFSGHKMCGPTESSLVREEGASRFDATLSWRRRNDPRGPHVRVHMERSPYKFEQEPRT